MILFSDIRQETIAGKLLRFPLRFLPRDMPVRILQGRLMGKKWIVGSYKHGCWLGSYELSTQRLMTSLIEPGKVFFDLGANVGFYTLLASVLVRENGTVFAFEPLPRNLHYLDRHMELNRVTNVTVVRAAVSSHPGKTLFYDMGEEGGGGQISSAFDAAEASTRVPRVPAQATLPVDLVQLDDLVSRGEAPAPDYIKIDVEGAEADVLAGSRTILKTQKPIIFLSTHGRDAHDRCLTILTNSSYICEPLNNGGLDSCTELAARPRAA